MQDFFSKMQEMIKNASAKQYDDDHRQAVSKSLDKYHANSKRHREILRIIAERLRPHKLNRVSILGEGDCPFEAVDDAAHSCNFGPRAIARFSSLLQISLRKKIGVPNLLSLSTASFIIRRSRLYKNRRQKQCPFPALVPD